MNILITVSTYLLDMLILTVFLNSLFSKKTSLQNEFHFDRLYFAALITVELVLYLNEILLKNHPFPYAKAITIAISLLTTLLLCFFFKASVKAKLLAAFVFQILASMGEILFTYIVSKANPLFLSTDNTDILYNTMNGGSKLILLILCIALSFFRRKDNITMPQAEYNALLLTTPVITLFIYCLLPLKIIYKGDTFFYNSLFLSLALLNIINFILIQGSRKYAAIEFKNLQMEQQLTFQKEKYNQLSEAYRQNRRIIHDVKKHYFSIQEYIRHDDLQNLLDYTHSAITDLESTYVRYNTGNLVIDAFLTNYETIFHANHITFDADLNVDCNRIPVDDYNLCIILGNLLDNALEACSSPGLKNRSFFIAIETTDNDKFRIHTENAYPYNSDAASDAARKDTLNHGYGLANMEKAVQENNGFLSTKVENLFILDILIPIIDENMRRQSLPCAGTL